MARPTAKRGERTEANPTGEIREERTEAKTDEESDDNRSILRTEDEDSDEEEERVPVHTCRERNDWEATPVQRELEAMRKLFIEGLGFNDTAARFITEQEQVDKASVLAPLDYDQCEQIVKNTRKQVAFGKAITVADRSMRNFQLAVTVAKHYERTSRVLKTSDIDVSLFPAFKAQKEIKDQQR